MEEEVYVIPMDVSQEYLERMRESFENALIEDNPPAADRPQQLIIAYAPNFQKMDQLKMLDLECAGFIPAVFTEDRIGKGIDEFEYCKKAGIAAAEDGIFPAMAFYFTDAVVCCPGKEKPIKGVFILGRTCSGLNTSSFIESAAGLGNTSCFRKVEEPPFPITHSMKSPLDAYYESFEKAYTGIRETETGFTVVRGR